MDGWEGAGKPRFTAQFLKRHVGFACQQFLHGCFVNLENLRFATTQVMAWCDITSVAALLNELFDHPQRDLIAACDLVAGSFSTIVGSQDAFAQIHRKSSHARR